MSRPCRPPEPLLTAEDVCGWLSIGRRHLYRLTERGRIPHLKISNRLRFERAAIQQWLAEQRRGGRDDDRQAMAREVGG